MKKFIVKILVLLTVFTAVLGVGVACKDKKPSSPAKQYVITFNIDGDEYATLLTSGKEQLTLPESPQKRNYVFSGWFMDSDYEVPFSKDSFINENLTEDITVYAKWDYKNFTAKFVADGNIVSTKTFTIEDSVISDMPSVPEKDGWSGEWEEYTLSDGRYNYKSRIYCDYL